MIQFCFATNNAHKIEEVKDFLGDKYDIISLKQIGFTGDLDEDYDTLQENSAQKAWFVNKNFNINCFADDSGLEVYALNNEPGVKSARYAGLQRSDSDNTELLLKKLIGVTNRKARFRTVVSLIYNSNLYQFEGIVEGQIIEELRGRQGFGYDPVFVPEGYVETFAQMGLQEKNKISHRARAVEKLVNFLKTLPEINKN